MQSMTGYAYKEAENSEFSCSVEIRSWNSRFLDLGVSLPPWLGRLESRFRQRLTGSLQRGKVELTVKIKRLKRAAAVTVDAGLARSFKAALEELAGACGISGPVPLELIAAQEGVLCVQDDMDIEEYWAVIAPLFEAALGDFIRDRKREGDNLRADILERARALEGACGVFNQWQDQMEGVFRETVAKKFREVLGDQVDEQRVLTEIAALLVKYTVSEEIVRIRSHLQALRSELDSPDAPGRKLDFICQELNREINTLGAKNQNLEVAASVLEAKNALESIKEQARNVE